MRTGRALKAVLFRVRRSGPAGFLQIHFGAASNLEQELSVRGRWATAERVSPACSRGLGCTW